MEYLDWVQGDEGVSPGVFDPSQCLGVEAYVWEEGWCVACCACE